jgi:ubiquinone/menaquinone biosynthesis C-methylase UbiE
LKRKTTIRKPRRDDRPLWDVVFSVYGAPAVLLAHKFRLFPFLANRPRSFAEICKHLGLADRPAETILAANAALGFVKLKGGRYSLTPLSEDYLLESSPTYFGSYFDLIVNNYPVCSIENLEKAVRTDSPQVYGGAEVFKSHEEQASSARAFTLAMHSISMAAAMAWPNAISLSKNKMMLDVGGGSGAHSIGAVTRWPKLMATVFDIAPVCEVAGEIAQQAGLQNRISTHIGDMWNDPFPPADVHFYSYIYHDWPPEKCRFLSRKSFESLNPGGRLIVHEVLYNRDKTGPFAAAAYTMIMLGWTTGRQYSGHELAGMLREAGFKSIKVKPTFGYMSIVSGVKP